MAVKLHRCGGTMMIHEESSAVRLDSPVIICARTRLAAEGGLDAARVEEHLESLRRQWNQFGLEALVRARGRRGAITVHYRLSISGQADPTGVHAAFRDDLSRALGGLSAAVAGPPSWDLAAMAAAAGREQVTASALTYDADDDYDWRS